MRLVVVLENPATQDLGAVWFGLAVVAVFAVVLLIAWLSRHGRVSGPILRAVGIVVTLLAGLLGLVAGVAGVGLVAWAWVGAAAASVWLLTLRRQE